ncbi:MAG TPA: hypothetical protein VGB13_02650 [Candidatus Krumholzibacteria bacterium]
MTTLAFISTADPLARPGSIFSAENRLHLSVVLTLLLLLLYSHPYWYVNLPLSILAIASLIFPVLSTSRVTWAAVTAIIVLGSLENWYALDNHKYLLGYWCLALLCFFASKCDPTRLATTARALIVLVFGFAVLQKTLSGDFLDSSFIHYELLLDERFHGLARYLGGVPDHLVELNVSARAALVSFDSDLEAVALRSMRMLEPVARAITWGTYGIELLIALAFLSPRSGLLGKNRDVLLLSFLLTTYLLAPVIGFGWVLAIMGIAQTADDRVRTRGAYVAAFLLLQSYRVPWGEAWSAIARMTQGGGA